MLQQAKDLLEEGAELKKLLDTLAAEDWRRPTPFKDWTVNQVVQHLHGADKAAYLALTDGEGFATAKADPAQVAKLMNPVQEGEALLDAWWSYLQDLCGSLGEADPKQRVPWFGPDMGVMMFTSARQMETWAHGQDIFDLFGKTRRNGARLKNIAVLGVRTYGWTFANRGEEPPGPAPHVRLTAPDGSLWEFNDPDDANLVEGDAADFCHVVTQGRNIQDVNLKVVGAPAIQWMAIAQCFAGPPETPPTPGARLANFK